MIASSRYQEPMAKTTIFRPVTNRHVSRRTSAMIMPIITVARRIADQGDKSWRSYIRLSNSTQMIGGNFAASSWLALRRPATHDARDDGMRTIRVQRFILLR